MARDLAGEFFLPQDDNRQCNPVRSPSLITMLANTYFLLTFCQNCVTCFIHVTVFNSHIRAMEFSLTVPYHLYRKETESQSFCNLFKVNETIRDRIRIPIQVDLFQ